MRVYLDTSLFPTDFGLRSPRLQSVLATARDLGIQIVVPEVVVLELVAHYRDQLTDESETITRAERHIGQLFAYAGENRTFEAPDIDKVVASYDERVRAQLADSSVEVGTLPEVMHRDLIARDLRRRKPFRRIVDAERGKDKGSTGYRDALIWETVARSAASDDVPVVLITQ